MKERKMVKANTFERWGEIAEFVNKGDTAEGVLHNIREIKTEYGQTSILDLKADNGVKISVFLSSALQRYEWGDYIGRYINIEYIGDRKNPKTKRTFKNFDVSISEEAEVTTEDLPF